MSKFDSLKNTQVTPKTAAICIVALLVVVSSGIFTVKKIVSQPPETIEIASKSKKTEQVKVDVKEKPANTDSKQKTDVKKDDKKEDKEAVEEQTAQVPAEDDPYSIIAERNLFKAVGAQTAVASNPIPKPPSNPRPMPPMPITPLPPMGGSRGGAGATKVAFTGIVETPQGIMALLENTSTSETKFAGVGESAFGMEVVSVNSRSVTLNSSGQTINLTLGENKSDASPAASGAAPPPGQPPAPSPGGPPPPSMGVPPMPSGPVGGFPVRGPSGSGRRRGGSR